MKIPKPPRICVVLSPLTSQLNPILGDTCIIVFTPRPTCAPSKSFPKDSNKGIVLLLKSSFTGPSDQKGISKRIPAVSLKSSDICTSS